MNKITLLLLAVVAFGGAAAWWWQSNTYSKEVLKLEILSPEETQAGEEVTYTVKWKNNGNVRLERAVLVFEFPKGALPSGDQGMRITQELEDIYPGQEQTREFKARLFGKAEETREARAQLSYTPKELSASFRSETAALTRISSVPLTFEFDTPSRVESGQEFEFNLNYFSQSAFPLSNLMVQIEYPEKFEFHNATPTPLGENEWRIGVLNQGDGGRIAVRGALEGGLQDVHIFKASIGSWNEGEFTLLKEIHKGVEISEPNLIISHRINGQEEYTVFPGETLHYEIFFRNAGKRNLENLFLVVNLEGRPLDPETLTAPRGTVAKGNLSMSWEARNVNKLRFLGQQEEGKVEFWVNAKEDWETFSPQDKDFRVTTRVLLSDTERAFTTKAGGALAIEQEGSFAEGPFENSGPIPPRVGSSTTYTVQWKAKSLYTDKRDVKVKATLPAGVEMTGKIEPSSAPLTYDSSSREVVWDIADMKAGTGTNTDALQVSFQVRLTPRSGQDGSVVPLMGDARISGTDTFIGEEVKSTGEIIQTTLPEFSEDQSVVQN